YSYERQAISGLGYCAIATLISKIRVHRRMPWRYASMFSTVLGSLFMKWSRLNDARLQAVSSKNIYSEQGLEPLIRPSARQVCHSFIVVSNCTPGSALAQAALPMRSHRSRAGSVLL